MQTAHTMHFVSHAPEVSRILLSLSSLLCMNNSLREDLDGIDIATIDPDRNP